MPHTQRAFDALTREIPTLRSLNPSTFLYVGWRHDCKPWWYDTLVSALGIKDVTVLEIFSKNVSDLETSVWAGRYDLNVVQGDVRLCDEIFGVDAFDIVFWDHGPEHVSSLDFDLTTSRLKKIAKKAIVYSCPWGEWPQEEEDGNQYEIHRFSVYPSDFASHGFRVITTGTAGQIGEGELLGIYIK